MKHVFLFLTALTLSVFSSKAQSIEVINRQVTNDRATVNTLRDDLNSRGGGQAACGPDTLIYALAKATSLNIVNVNNATSVFAVSQYFDAPQDITINGASFYGFKADATGGITSNVSVSVYLAGPDSLPAGAPITSGTVAVDTAFGGGSLAVLIKHANFSPVTVSQPYCVVVENDSPNPIGMVTSDYTVGDGQGEWLASANLFGDWLHGYDLVLGPDQFDADALIEPHVEYSLEAGFDQTGVCIGATGGDGTWQNTSSPVLGNRMYSVAAFLGSPELQYSWDYGDGSGIANTVDGVNTYAGNSPWTVTLTDTLFGWTVICVDEFIQDAETVEAGTLTAGPSPVCIGGTITATQNDAPVVPAGYETIYVLTQGAGLVIVDAQPTPSFTATAAGDFTVHTLVYDPNTLDLAIIQFGTTTGFDVNGLLVQGGGSICAALDVAGAQVTVEGPEAGTLTAGPSPVCVGGTITATQNDAPVVPAGYETIYVLTQGAGLVIVDAQPTPSFTATVAGDFTVHTLVYDPNTLDLGIVQFGTTTGFDVNGLLVQGGGSICAALDVAGAQVTVEGPEAGTLTAGPSPVCVGGTITATQNDAPVVPAGYETIYVLTQGAGLVIVDAQPTPSFTATAAGDFTVHTLVYDPNTLDLAIIQFGTTTGFDVNGLLVQGGGSICAALDVAGAQVTVEGPQAGTLEAVDDTVCLVTGLTVDISALEVNAPTVPTGYQSIYVLTSGAGLVIEQVNGTPDFTVSAGGEYTIHTLVYDPNTLDLGIVQFGTTTGFDVNGLLVQGGGSICAALDVAGAPIVVEGPDAGTLTADANPVCVGGTLSATHADAPIVPAGYETIYVLTEGAGLVIIDAQPSASFTASAAGDYTIHTLVYDPNTLDLGIVQFGTTTGFDVNGLISQGGGSICAALDVAGAQITVEGPTAGTLEAVEDTVCLVAGGTVDIAAVEVTAPVLQSGYEIIYVLTSGTGLVIEQVNATPDFTVSGSGLYTIHTLAYDPNTLDLGIVQFGTTTGFDVNGLLVQGGGSICAALDVAGAPIVVEGPDAGTLTADANPVCVGGILSATHADAPIVPAGYETVYVLTEGAGLVIIDAQPSASFTASAAGDYTIHTLVYDPNTLDLGIVQFGTTTGFDVNGLISQGGGSICAALDVAGAQITVEGPTAGTLEAVEDTVCLVAGGTVDIAAVEVTAPVLQSGYEIIYVLTSGTGLVIEQVNATPDFTVSGSGLYTIHTLAYDPNTLDLGIVQFGTTTGFDVNGLLVQGGGSICAALDVAGAPIVVEGPEAGTLTANANTVCLFGGSANISASQANSPVVPAGYEVVYVLTEGTGLVIQDAQASPTFTVTAEGDYTIHTLVYDPNTLDLGIVQFGTTTGFDVNGLISQGGGSICAALDVAGAAITVEVCPCDADAGSLTALASPVCLNQGSAIIGAAQGNAPVVPTGFETIYVLTQGSGLVILDAQPTPEFTVNAGGDYTIHTLIYDPNTLDLGIVQFGTTTGFDVNGLLIQGGGSICASLDVAGAQVIVEGPEAGTLTADASPVCVGGTITATQGDAPVVPSGYETIYVLTQGAGLVIVDAQPTPEFTATATGDYTVHTLVYDPNTLDLGIVQFGTTTGFDVNGLLVQGGGSICAALDVAGASVTVVGPEAGTLVPDATPVCLVSGTANISATVGDAPVVPNGYEVIYVLTEGAGLVIEDAQPSPNFTVTAEGDYTIHTLVYDPNTLDLGIVQFGTTTGFDVNGLLVQGGGSICAALDVAGASIMVEDCPCDADAGTLTADASPVCLANGEAVISATVANSPTVPAGYETIYVLTQGSGLVIVDAQAIPEFIVTEGGNYTIHTLVYDPNTLDLGIVQFGATTGFDVNGLLIQGGGSICASLDVVGAPISVVGPNAGTLVADAAVVCLDGGSADISASHVDNPEVPAGYAVFYVLTDADNNLEVLNGSINPEFTVAGAGNYIIHTLVYDPNTLDPASAIGLPAADVNALLVQGGGSVCASLDLAGAPITVEGPKAGSLVADASTVCLTEQGDATISATEDDAPVVPNGYLVLYVLTDADNNLEILDAAATPEFTVSGEGNYIIHTLVYDPNTLTPTTAIGLPAADVNGLLVQGGGSICAALDLTGAPIAVVNCTSVRELGQESLTVYPNPSNGEFVIELNGLESEDTEILVFDMAGRQVYSEMVYVNNDFRKELNLDVAQGTYLLRIVTAEAVVSRKLQFN